MEVLQDGVLAFLAATGLAALFWLLTGWFRRREPARVMLLIPARPGCDFAAPAAQMLDLRRQLRGGGPHRAVRLRPGGGGPAPGPGADGAIRRSSAADGGGDPRPFTIRRAAMAERSTVEGAVQSLIFSE